MWTPGTKTELLAEDLKPFNSPYIMEGGQNQDVFQIDKLTVDGRECHAQCSFPKYFTSPTDTSFHLSVQRSVDLVTQIALTHALVLNGIDKKEVEIWMPEISLRLTKPQRDPNNIKISLFLYGRTVVAPTGQRKSHRTFYRWRIEIGDGDWFGNVTYCLPIEG